MTEELLSWKLDHIGIIVRDLEKSIEFYRSLGAGQFHSNKPVQRIERKWLGKLVPLDIVNVIARSARLGSVDIELLQPFEGESVWRNFLETKGEGMHHIGFLVDDIEKEEVKLVKEGCTVVLRSRFKNGGLDYVDMGKIGGVLIEIIQWPPE